MSNESKRVRMLLDGIIAKLGASPDEKQMMAILDEDFVLVWDAVDVMLTADVRNGNARKRGYFEKFYKLIEMISKAEHSADNDLEAMKQARIGQ